MQICPMKNKALPNNFGGLPARYSKYQNAAIVVLPVPFDKTSTWVKGSAKGPRAIINASRNMELYDIETASEVYTKGIHTAKSLQAKSSATMVKSVFTKCRAFLDDDKFVITLGGEHTVALGAIQAHAEHFADMSILHLDAHSDMRDSYEGSKFNHACVMARALEMTDHVVSVGIRSMDTGELKNVKKKNMFYASKIVQSRDWVPRVLKRLTRNVYITIDLDVFDPSIMPSTGTPEPGGLGWYDVMSLLERVIKSKNVIGFDVVELCPSGNVAPDFLAAKLIYKLLSLKYCCP